MSRAGRCAATRRPLWCADSQGFTLLELLISMSIMLVVTGAIFALVNPGTGAYGIQPEVANMQQRLRMASSFLHRDLMMAGAGPYTAAPGTSTQVAAGPLLQYLAPVQPYRTGRIDPDPDQSVYYRPDAITIRYVPDTASQTTTLEPIGSTAASVGIQTAVGHAGCPVGDAACGFEVDDTVLVFDDAGASDAFRVTAVAAGRLTLQAQSSSLSSTYPAGVPLVRAVTHTYYLDTSSDQLVRYDGWDTPLPLVDDVVALTFRYFGDPAATTVRCPSGGAGTTALPEIVSNQESLVELVETDLTDGPWCGITNRFDADLYRIRTVRAEVRVQVGPPELRGADPTLFHRPGYAVLGTRMVPDIETRLDVSPRNMNVAR